MAETNANAKLAERLIGIGAALRDAGKSAAGKPAAKVSAELVDFEVARRERKKEVAAAAAFLEQSAAGQQVVKLLQLLLEDVGVLVCSHAETLVAFEQRLEAVKAELATKAAYTGIWEAEAAYQPNDVVTFKGQLWACEQPNCAVRPGSDDRWRLMHKRENL